MAPEILLIDDDVFASALRKRVLERQSYRVQMALEAASGIALANALHPALILMDHRLPGMNGPELLVALRERHPNTPIIVHSGYDFLPSEYTAKPNCFLTKGDSVEAMLQTIAQLL